MSRIKVACAIIVNDDKVLVVQRSETMSLPLKWEFPGGKLENDEAAEECIHREILEELNLKIEVQHRISSSLFDYPNISIELIPFICMVQGGELVLKEHKAYQFLSKDQLQNLDWAEADLPILYEYLSL